MFINDKYKVLHLTINKQKQLLPTINNSYLYTLWVLNHKYNDVILHDITTTTYAEFESMSVDFDTRPVVHYTIPQINPLVNVSSIPSVVCGLGTDACLVLGFDVDQIIKQFNTSREYIPYSKCSMYFDNYIVKLQTESVIIHGQAPKLLGLPFYKYSSLKRKAFNRRAEKIRKLLRRKTTRTKLHTNKHIEEDLTPAMRDYYESQLHDFVYTYIYKGKTSYGK